MRKTTKFRVLGGSTLALGLVAAGAAAVTNTGAGTVEAEPVSSAASDVAETQAEAMQRDLGLTAVEAVDLMKEQIQAAAVDSQLRGELGEAFGGSWFDIDSGELTVMVSDTAAYGEVEAAGAVPQLVTYGQDTLNEAVEQLNAEGASLADGIAGWYPDTASDTVVITALEGQTAAAEELAAAAGLDADMVQVEETSEEPRLYADIVGGDAYIIGGSGRCSIGFAVEGGFATAGHCGGVGTSVATRDGSGTGTVGGSIFPGADMGFVQADSNWTPTPVVNDYAGGTVPVAGATEAPEGAAVCRSGSTTGWHCGTIQAKNRTVSYPEGIINGLTQTTACAEPGDSGGSWLSGDQAQGVTSGGSGNCTTGGTTFFQPLQPLLTEFGLTLVTT